MKHMVASRVSGCAAFAVTVAHARDAALVEAARKEGTVSIHASTDSARSRRLQEAFTAKYGISIAYNDLGTNGAYNQAISEAAIPGWANYQNLLHGMMVEPIGMIYNTRALSEDRLPQTHAELISFLRDNRDELQGKVATFDPEKRAARASSTTSTTHASGRISGISPGR